MSFFTKILELLHLKSKPKPVVASISMQAKDWMILFSNGYPYTPFSRPTGWIISFITVTEDNAYDTNALSMHYVLTPFHGILRQGQVLSATLKITATNGTVFNSRIGNNPGGAKPNMRFIIQRFGDTLTEEFWRWWSNPDCIELAPGTFKITVPLTPDRWSSVKGKRGTDSPEATAGFSECLSDIGAVGFTFGGGSYFGHGVNVIGGEASVELLSFTC